MRSASGVCPLPVPLLPPQEPIEQYAFTVKYRKTQNVSPPPLKNDKGKSTRLYGERGAAPLHWGAGAGAGGRT